MIPQRNLSLLSNRLARQGGRRIPEVILEQDYCLSWFLVGLSKTPLTDILAFKGGTAIKKCYMRDYRFSEDLDFTMREETSFENIQEHLKSAYDYSLHASGIKFSTSRYDHHPHENSHTFFIRYEGPLPGATGKEVKIDITIREWLSFPIEMRPILKAYQEYEDLPEDAIIGVYSLNEIASEKIIAILDPARNEPRDLYDLCHLTGNQYVRLDELKKAVEEKMRFRGRELTDIRDEIHALARIQRLYVLNILLLLIICCTV